VLRGPSTDRKESQRRLIDAVARFLAGTPRTWSFSLALTLGIVALATLLRVGLHGMLGARAVFAAYYLAVTLSAVLGGYRAGLLAIALSALAGWYFFAERQGAFAPMSPVDTTIFSIFVVSTSVNGLIAASLRQVILQLRDRDLELSLIADELRHRVKNVLSLVLSVSRQTARNAHEVPAFQAAFEARVKALAHAHDILARSGWAGAGLRELISAHLSPFVSPEGPRLLLEGDDLTVDPDTAVSLSLMLHELATNAVKYGSLSTPKGELRLSWRCDRVHNALMFEWLERGGPRVEPPRRKGFGATLMARTLAPDGRIDYEPDGVHVIAAFPLAGGAPPETAPEAAAQPQMGPP
jgi:two-component sensor histidine kinase